MQKSNLVSVIDKLVLAEYVERFLVNGDRRSNNVKITKKGRDYLEAIEPKYFSKINELVKGLSENEQEQIITASTKLSENVRKQTI